MIGMFHGFWQQLNDDMKLIQQLCCIVRPQHERSVCKLTAVQHTSNLVSIEVSCVCAVEQG